MKKFDKYGLVVAVVSFLGVLSGNTIGPPIMLLGGGIALLIRSFFPPLSLKHGLAAWFGGALMGIPLLGVPYMAGKFNTWSSAGGLLIVYIPLVLLGAFLIYSIFRKGKKSPG